MSERQLARVLGFPQATMNRTLQSLAETGLIKPQKVGRATTWDFDREGYLYDQVAPVLKALKAVQAPLPYLKRLISRTLQIPKGYRLIIFGSTASGEDTSSSDIDLGVILPGSAKEPSAKIQQHIEKLQDLCWDKFGKALNPYFINQAILKRQPKKELHRNILKGVEISA